MRRTEGSVRKSRGAAAGAATGNGAADATPLSVERKPSLEEAVKLLEEAKRLGLPSAIEEVRVQFVHVCLAFAVLPNISFPSFVAPVDLPVCLPHNPIVAPCP